MPITKEMLEKRAAAVRTGGKGTVRRTTKAAHKSNVNDNKQIQGALKKLGVTPLGETEEAYFFRTDGTAYCFKNPKVQTSMQSQCFVVAGNYETKSMKDMMPTADQE
jgi:nascent polypeptide-associated complex subunit beta|eukprot:CAMPEP_0205824702 /NCGR_PEP_ID=MMETSP0206-20130828/22286_1 /ASSEMBLY_ACC=CAM_ASM_000279 /TAXON_ID=36767 /ORGANISM="Euplotes focardii, Strain TN1" /LENGTH=106 /DNA_ID=CAMNT_0053123081 /DNA_START=27 /DNA_END=347 /DNA_ORIENTATION=+